MTSLFTKQREQSINKRYYEMGNRTSSLLPFQLQKAQANRILQKIKRSDNNQQEVDSVRRALNLQATAARRDAPSMLSLDAEKAFDRDHWTFLQKSLSWMGFSEAFEIHGLR